MADKQNGKVTNIELEMMVDEMMRLSPYVIKGLQENAKQLKVRYDALKQEGFTDQQALEIVKVRGAEF